LRDWLCQTPMNILIKASNGASDFLGINLVCNNWFCINFWAEENSAVSTAKARKLGYDKVIMQAVELDTEKQIKP
jgi:phosphoribosylformylglycinamidine synthase